MLQIMEGKQISQGWYDADEEDAMVLSSLNLTLEDCVLAGVYWVFESSIGELGTRIWMWGKICSESISLHKACQNAIYYDLNYNAAEFLQSLDRIHRVGGSEIHPVYYNFLHYEKTVDTKIFERVFLKADRQMQIIEEDNLTFDLNEEEENWEHLYNDLNLWMPKFLKISK